MATIEELRERDREYIEEGKRSTPDGYLNCGPCVITIMGPNPTDPPEAVLMRLTNGTGGDVCWLTADGELHFGARALAGLTRHILKELALTNEANLAEDNGPQPPRDVFGAELGQPGVYRRTIPAEQTQGDEVLSPPNLDAGDNAVEIGRTEGVPKCVGDLWGDLEPLCAPLTDEQSLEGMRQWDAEILRLREQEAARAAKPRNPFEAHKPLE